MSCGKSSDTQWAKVDTPTSLGQAAGYNTPEIKSKSYAGVTNIGRGNSESLNEGCFPPKSSEQQPADSSSVCHFWSANHGMESGITTYHSKELILPVSIGKKIAQSNCGTTRMVFNNCFSGQFMKLAIDADGNAIPGICGVSATSRSEVAVGSGVDLKTVTDSQGNEFLLAGINYDFTSEFNKALMNLQKNGKIPTMDEAFAIAQMNDPQSEFPTSTSSYFIKEYRKKKGTNNVESESLLIDCLGARLGLNIFSSQLSDLSLAMDKVAKALPQKGLDLVSAEMQALAKKDIENQRRHLAEFEKKLCKDFYQGECDPAHASEFIQAKYNEGALKVQAEVAQELKQLREVYAEKYATQERLKADHKQSTDKQRASEIEVKEDLRKAQEELRLNYQSAETHLQILEQALATPVAELAAAKGKEAKAAAQTKIDQKHMELEAERVRQEVVNAKIAALEAEKKRLEQEKIQLEASNPYNSPLEEELKTLNARIDSLSTSALLDVDKIAPKSGFAADLDMCGVSDKGQDNKEKFSTLFNRYAEMRENFAATAQMMTLGDAKDINNYLTIKQCEMTDFYKPAF